MEFRASPVSRSLNFPGNLARKPYSVSQLFFGESQLRPPSNRNAASLPAVTKTFDSRRLTEQREEDVDSSQSQIQLWGTKYSQKLLVGSFRGRVDSLNWQHSAGRYSNSPDQMWLDFDKRNSWIHFVGIGGSGLSALAMLALKQGFKVTGSDIAWSCYMDRLQEAGAHLHIGHSVCNIHSSNGSEIPNAIVVSSAIPHDNMEIVHANSLGVPVYKRDHWLGILTEQYRLIAISGTHGKSTTSGMLAYVLKAMGVDLTAVIGAEVPQLPEGNVIIGSSHRDFILEADEYDGCFLGVSPYLAIVTNLEWEHTDFFKDEESVRSIFKKFLNKIRADGHLILCRESSGVCSLLDQVKHIHNYKITTYGMSDDNDWHASSIRTNSHGDTNYELFHRGHRRAEISLRIPGIHNVLNSLAVIAAVVELQGEQRDTLELIRRLKPCLRNFIGVNRRFEKIGKIHGCVIYDDYAHHPTEVSAVLQTARQMFPHKSLLVVFQPHTHSRLLAMKDDFAKVLCAADHVIVTQVYAARETNKWNISGGDLAASIIGPPSEYIHSLSAVVDKLVLQIVKDPHWDLLVITLGSGDITTVGRKLFRELQNKFPGFG